MMHAERWRRGTSALTHALHESTCAPHLELCVYHFYFKAAGRGLMIAIVNSKRPNTTDRMIVQHAGGMSHLPCSNLVYSTNLTRRHRV